MDSIYGHERRKLGIQQPSEPTKQRLSMETGILILAVLLPVMVFCGRIMYRNVGNQVSQEEVAIPLFESAKTATDNRQLTTSTESDTPVENMPPVEAVQTPQTQPNISSAKATPLTAKPLDRPQQSSAMVDSRIPAVVPVSPPSNQQRNPPMQVESRPSTAVANSMRNPSPREISSVADQSLATAPELLCKSRCAAPIAR